MELGMLPGPVGLAKLILKDILRDLYSRERTLLR